MMVWCGCMYGVRRGEVYEEEDEESYACCYVYAVLLGMYVCMVVSTTR